MPTWILVPPMVLVFASVFSEEIFDPPFIEDDGTRRPAGKRGCWGCPCGVEFTDPFADEEPEVEEECPVCKETTCHDLHGDEDLTSRKKDKPHKYIHCLV
eukprot:TRINITY_DN22232_c0_g1_i2.p4 TRINITY_DN22232_c0_g1~~TRINITY_DN22232_c0_g1_i2.p4  ORF type:complete len:100 (+),score=16.73 TRINITY_DN22232_c0_g1_i2:43-342(+)